MAVSHHQFAEMLDPDKFHFLPLGIGNAFTSRHYNSSFLMLFGGKAVLVDAPAPLSRVVREAGEKAGLPLNLRDFDAVVLTHLHGDHCNGLEELGFWRRYIADGERARLFLLPELVEPLWKHRLFASLGPELHETKPDDTTLETYFEIGELVPGKPGDLGIEGFRIEVHYTRHFIPCIGFRATWRGRTLGYSSDTSFFPPLMEFLSPSDRIIHETGVGNGHTDLAMLLALPENLRRRICLTHIADDFDSNGSSLPVLEEGRLYEV